MHTGTSSSVSSSPDLGISTVGDMDVSQGDTEEVEVAREFSPAVGRNTAAGGWIVSCVCF